MLRLLVVFVIWVCAHVGAAERQPAAELPPGHVEYRVVVTSEAKNPSDARKELLGKAQRQVARQVIRERLGEGGMARASEEVVEILKEPGKFIPKLKESSLQGESGAYRMEVNCFVSKSDLELVLNQHRLLSASEVPPMVLPLIRWRDSSDISWWQAKAWQKPAWNVPTRSFASQVPSPTPSPTPQPLLSVSEFQFAFESLMEEQFVRHGLFFLTPATSGFVAMIPEEMARKSEFSLMDYQRLGKMFRTPLLLVGDTSIESWRFSDIRQGKRVKIDWRVVQLPKGGALSYLRRSFVLDPLDFEKELLEILKDAAHDLASQMALTYRRGLFGTEKVVLVVRGGLSLKEREKLREDLLRQTEVRGVSDLLWTAKETRLVLDVTRSDFLEKWTWQPRPWKWIESVEGQVVVEVRSRLNLNQ